MAQNNILIEQYRTSPAVMKRNAAGLNAWAGSVTAQVIPPAPDEVWVKTRIVAERIPQQIDAYVSRTMGYFMQDPATVTNIWEFLNYNNDAKEVALSGQIESIIAAFMPRFADIDVTDQQAADWKTAHGIAA